MKNRKLKIFISAFMILMGLNTSVSASTLVLKDEELKDINSITTFESSKKPVKDKYFLSREIYENVPYVVYGYINESYNENWIEFKVDKTRNYIINFQNSCMKTDYYMNLYDSI